MKRIMLIIASALATVVFLAGAGWAMAAPETFGRGGPRGGGAGGEVTSIDGSTIVVTTRNEGTLNILTDAETSFIVNGEESDLSAISAGMFVHAQGEATDDGFAADTVRASTEQPERPERGDRPQRGAGGEITSIDGSTIVVTTRNESTLNILTDAETSFVVNGEESDLSAISAGMFVHADGAATDDGFAADTVRASTEQPERPEGPRGPGGPGRGRP
jgi:hypothetical protein